MSHYIDIIIENGKITTEIKGAKGNSCEDIEKQLKEIFGEVESSKKTREYHQKQHNVAKERVTNAR